MYIYNCYAWYVIFYTLVARNCPFDFDVKCNDTGRCYSSGSICDGYPHCRYGNDEENCGKETFKFICIICDWACLNRAYVSAYTYKFFPIFRNSVYYIFKCTQAISMKFLWFIYTLIRKYIKLRELL